MNFEEKLNEAFQLFQEKDLDHSLDIARELQNEDPQASEPFYLEGMIMSQLNQWEHAHKALTAAVKLNGSESRYYNQRGFVAMQQEALEKAEEDFDKAIELDDSAPAHRNKVMLMLMTDRGREAFPYLIDRIKKDPQDVENWILMGDMMKRAGQTDKAATYYEQALKLDPENDYARRQLEE